MQMNPRSALVTQGRDRSPNRGMLRALGMTDADFTKSQIGIASSWNQITPCNMSLRDIAAGVAKGVTAGGGFPMEFGTITVSDVISMGHEGMHFSLVSREVIADSVETVMQAERLDGMVTLAGCDKSIPAMLMAAARLTDGSEHTVNIVTSFEAVGANARGLMSDADLDIIERAVCPSAGTCGGMYTANTMASAAEAMGINTTKYKVLAFVIAAFFAGIAGGLYAHFKQFITPDGFNFMKSVDIVVMVILGGMGNTVGVCIAAVLLTILPELLRRFSKIEMLPEWLRHIAENRMILYSLLLIVLMLLRPQGLFGGFGKKKGVGK